MEGFHRALALPQACQGEQTLLRVWKCICACSHRVVMFFSGLRGRRWQVRIPDVESSTKVAALDVHFKMQEMNISNLTCPLDALALVRPPPFSRLTEGAHWILLPST